MISIQRNRPISRRAVTILTVAILMAGLPGEWSGRLLGVIHAADASDAVTGQEPAADPGVKPVLKTDLDKVRMTIGDIATFRIRAGFDTGTETGDAIHGEAGRPAQDAYRFVFPGDDLDVSPFTIVDRSVEVSESETGTWRTLVLKLSVYEIGEFEIPPVTVVWEGPGGATGELATDPEYIRVESLLTGDEESIRDLRPPVEVTARPAYIAGVIGVAVLIVAAIWLAAVLVRRLRRRSAAAAAADVSSEPLVPAHEKALERLKRLKASEYLNQGAIKPYFVELTEILKEYIGARFAFLAVEHTTQEIRRDMRKLQISPAIQSDILHILDLGDMVKFARYTPPDDACRDALIRVERIVISTLETRESASEKPGSHTQDSNPSEAGSSNVSGPAGSGKQDSMSGKEGS